MLYSVENSYFSGLLKDIMCQVAVLVASDLCIHFVLAFAASRDVCIIQ
jgi:hypothetical protein